MSNIISGNLGYKGEPGVSPTLSATKQDGVATITMTDVEGTKTFTLSDGEMTRDMTEAMFNEQFAILTGNIARATLLDTVNYPTGFTSTNCAIISLMTKVGGVWTTPFIQTSSGDNSISLVAYLNSDNIRLLNKYAYVSDGSYDYRIVLMKMNNN